MKAKRNNGTTIKPQEKKTVIFNGAEYTQIRANGGSVLLEGNGQRFIVHESHVTTKEEPKEDE